MISLIIDTNIWIYLAKGDHPFILDKILEMKNKGDIQFIVSEIQIEEWERNKNKIKDDLVKGLKFQYNQAKNLANFIKEPEREQFKKILQKELKNEADLMKIAEDKYLVIENILKHESVIAPITVAQKLKVADWALQAKAPFHKKANSFADALILLSGVDYVKEHSIHKMKVDGSPAISDSVFISYNHTDFSKGDKAPEKDIIHPDLEPLLSSIKMKYIRHIDMFLNLSTDMQLEIDEYWDYIDHLIDRHIEWEAEIMRGK